MPPLLSKTHSCRQYTPYALILGLGPLGAWTAIHFNLGLTGAKCHTTGLLVLLLMAPLVEETVFRLGLQRWLQKRINAWVGPLSLANLLTGVFFASLHVLNHGTPLMALTLMPALVLGWTWENGAGRLRYPVLVHVWYNLCLVVPSCF